MLQKHTNRANRLLGCRNVFRILNKWELGWSLRTRTRLCLRDIWVRLNHMPAFFLSPSDWLREQPSLTSTSLWFASRPHRSRSKPPSQACWTAAGLGPYCVPATAAFLRYPLITSRLVLMASVCIAFLTANGMDDRNFLQYDLHPKWEKV